MKKPPITQTLSDLTEMQRARMAHNLDRHTGYGLGTIGSVMRGEKGDLLILEVFVMLGMTAHQAKLHARKVLEYVPSEMEQAQYQMMKDVNPFRGGPADLTQEVEERYARFRAAKLTDNPNPSLLTVCIGLRETKVATKEEAWSVIGTAGIGDVYSVRDENGNVLPEFIPH